jgi:FkbM family methyltransferase
VVDAGAALGDFSVLAAQRIGPAGTVLAFEPSAEVRHRYLTPALDCNPALASRIKVIPWALSDTVGRTRLAMAELGSAYLDDAAPEGELVATVPLDDFLAARPDVRVDFLKADVEGAERLLLAGARRILATHAPRLAICTYHLPDDPSVLANRIREANPAYEIIQGPHKLYAYVPKEEEE